MGRMQETLKSKPSDSPKESRTGDSLTQGSQARLALAGGFQWDGAVSLFNRHNRVTQPRQQTAVSKAPKHPDPGRLGSCQGLRSPGAFKSCTLELFLRGSTSAPVGQVQNLSRNSWHQPLCPSISGKNVFFHIKQINLILSQSQK